MTRFHFGGGLAPAIIRLMPITVGTTRSSVVTSSGQRYWFQPKMKRIRNSAAMLARDSGTATSQKTASVGAVDACGLGQLVGNGEEELAEEERRRRRRDQRNCQTGVGVSMCRSNTTLNVGRIRTSTGSISVTKIIQNASARNGKRK